MIYSSCYSSDFGLLGSDITTWHHNPDNNLPHHCMLSQLDHDFNLLTVKTSNLTLTVALFCHVNQLFQKFGLPCSPPGSVLCLWWSRILWV